MRALRLVLPLIVLASLLLSATAALAAPANNNRAKATTIASLPATQTQGTAGATLQAGEPRPCGSIAATVWFRVTAPGSGEIVADTIGSTYDTVVAGYALGNDSSLACNDDVIAGTLQSEIAFPVSAGQTYELQAGGFEGATGKLVLNVRFELRPGNDGRVNATNIASLPSTQTQSTDGATLEEGEPLPPCAPSGATVWFRVTAPAAGVIVADTFGSDFDTVLVAYPFGSNTELACNDDSSSLSADPNRFRSEIAFAVSAGQTYELQVGGFGADTGNLTFNVRFVVPPQGDLFAEAIQVTPPVFLDEIDTANASVELGEPNPSCAFGGAPVGRTIWYRFEADLGGTLVATSLTSDFDTVLAAYEQTGSGFDGLTEVACNDDAEVTLQSAALVIPVEPGGTYYIQVGGWRGATGHLRFTFVGD